VIVMAADPLDEARRARELIEQWASRVDRAVTDVRDELARRTSTDDRGGDGRADES
jgi:hypothetical protein